MVKYIPRAQDTERMIIKIIFAIGDILKKKIGITPINNPIVVTPKAKPGELSMTDNKVPKEILIVNENRNTPIIEISILLLPINKNGTHNKVERTPTLRAPNLSLRTPPAILPIPIVKNNKNACHNSFFQEIGIAYPIYELLPPKRQLK